VIYRCWERTGILPDNEEVDRPMEVMEVDTEIDEVQSLIDQINVNNDDIITASSYIEVDSGLGTEMLDDDEIIAAVQEAPEEEEEEEDMGPPISNKIALESIQNLYNYLQQNNDIQVNRLFVSGLKDLKWKIDRKQNNSLVQTSMDIYLKE
jgi:hypothetical protein